MENFVMKLCLSILLFFCIVVPFSFAQDKTGRPRVFVTDEPLNEGDIMAHGWAGYGHLERGPNPRVVEIQTHLVKVCPQVIVTNRQDTADFILLFRRQNGQRSAMFAFGGLPGLALSAASKVDGASLFAANGDLVTATKQRTVGNAIKEVCTAIPLMVEHAAQRPAPAPYPGARRPVPPPPGAPQPIPGPYPSARQPIPTPYTDAQQPADARDARGCVQHGQYLSCDPNAGQQ
jgi:hypothetical protein